jgi:hypothetical protein
LVRRAQRLEDRGDLAGARRTVAQAEEAMTQWAARLDRQPRQRERTAEPVGRGAGPLQPAEAPGFGGFGRSTADPGMAPGATPAPVYGGRGGMTRSPGAGSPDVESRLREVEAKLDRLLKEMEKPRAGEKK